MKSTLVSILVGSSLATSLTLVASMNAAASSDHQESHQHQENVVAVEDSSAQGHGEHHHGGHMDTLAGKPGIRGEVDKTIEVTADDTMIFYLDQPLQVKDGETIKFVVTNNGHVEHEFAIGTKDEHVEHGAMMMQNPGMVHAAGGNAITLKPGETKELIWTFEEAWQVQVACNIPGHYEAGMHKLVSFVE
ncbi:hypothetical protein BTA51_29520 [Hahella sp. CCB-MM4]|uniref:cupredoxin domain-containing protein n=1 Tax=Hahella sp. (strain CCB-MM4) TaxID=1926491 RepID=UPI000B9BD474|nr:cupredoxin family protein [Hahella sp. CCB-MM4]OZG69765.1 hypothetical protein BTA51_29520 [Hahella sp. CCB-MM4]